MKLLEKIFQRFTETPCEKIQRWLTKNQSKITNCSVSQAKKVLDDASIRYEVRHPEHIYALYAFDGIILYSRDGLQVDSAEAGC